MICITIPKAACDKLFLVNKILMNILDTGLLKETKRPMCEGGSSKEASLIISIAVFVYQLIDVEGGVRDGTRSIC
jgi:hypothetical protein